MKAIVHESYGPAEVLKIWEQVQPLLSKSPNLFKGL